MRISKYLKKCNFVYHTTLDPNQPGVARIHLVPPKKLKAGIPWVVIVNGYSVLPLQTSWAILLKEFMDVLNKKNQVALNEKQIETIKEKTVEQMKELFKGIEKDIIAEDLDSIIDTLKALALGEEPCSEIGYMTLAQYGKYMQAPHRMDLMISAMEKNGCWNCNQKCLHCYASGEKMSNTLELNSEQWKTIIDACRKACIPALTFTGGEPTMREDLVELVEYASWFVTRLNTNGVLLSRKLCRELFNASLDSVQITLYSFDESIHNTLVGGNHFKQAVEGVKNALSEGLNVSINTPLCSLNRDYVKTLEFVRNLGIQYVSCSGLIPSGNALKEDSKITALSHKEMKMVVSSAFEFTKERKMEIAFTSPGWLLEEDLVKMKMVVPSCGACLSNMAIAPDGTVIPCQSWLHEDGLGNMLTDKWKDIWNQKKCKQQRYYATLSEQRCPLKKGNCE